MTSTPAAARTLVIIPTYNERDNLEPLLEELLGAQPDVHVLVVDDASPDGTAEVARARARADERVFVLERGGKEGLGRAYADAFAWALAQEPAYDLIAHMDADGSHPPRYLGGLRQACVDGADVAIGSRYVSGGGVVGWVWYRRWLSKMGSLYARTVLGVPVRDLTAGFKCFRRDVLARLVEFGLVTNGYGFQIETTYGASRLGFRVVERPILFPDRVRGESKMSWPIALEAISMVWRLKARFERTSGQRRGT